MDRHIRAVRFHAVGSGLAGSDELCGCVDYRLHDDLGLPRVYPTGQVEMSGGEYEQS